MRRRPAPGEGVQDNIIGTASIIENALQQVDRFWESEDALSAMISSVRRRRFGLFISLQKV